MNKGLGEARLFGLVEVEASAGSTFPGMVL
jgi:hypothetical protein